MMNRIHFSVVIVIAGAAVLAPGRARASESGGHAAAAEASQPIEVPLAVKRSSLFEGQTTRIYASVGQGVAGLHRSVTDAPVDDKWGAGVSGMLRLYPASRHGIFVSGTFQAGLWGPDVASIDFGYARMLIGTRTLRGLGGAVHAEVGPSVAVVWRDPRIPAHTSLGGYAGLSADLHIWHFTLGAYAGYRGGIALDAPRYEGIFQAGLRAGALFDLSRPK